MSGISDPLTPLNCDLRDFPFMPIDIGRLFASEFHALSNDGEWRAGFTLWLRSYHQVPAASLPDDDVALARLAELGRDVKAWRKVKAGALRGWLKCSDGRLYHPVVAEKALEAWASKLLQRKASAAGNAKRYGAPFDPIPFDEDVRDTLARVEVLNPSSRVLSKRFLKASIRPPTGTPDGLPVGDKIAPTGSFESSHRDPDGTPTGTPDGLPVRSQETGTGTGTGTIERKDSCPKRAPPDRTRKVYPDDFEMFWAAYPTDPNMAKAEAGKAWARLGEADRAMALAAVPGFVAHCRKDQTYRPLHAVRFLNQRRFEGFAAAADLAKADNGPTVDLGPGAGRVLESTVVDVIRRGGWIDHWGPAIGKPGCRVPERLIEAARRIAA